MFSVQATAEANNLTAVAGAKDLYSKNMEKVWQGGGGRKQRVALLKQAVDV